MNLPCYLFQSAMNWYACLVLLGCTSCLGLMGFWIYIYWPIPAKGLQAMSVLQIWACMALAVSLHFVWNLFAVRS